MSHLAYAVQDQAIKIDFVTINVSFLAMKYKFAFVLEKTPFILNNRFVCHLNFDKTLWSFSIRLEEKKRCSGKAAF